MLAYAASLCFLMFCISALHDLRRFSNAVLLGISVALMVTYGIEEDGHAGGLLAMLLFGSGMLVGSGVLALTSLLVLNGVMMARKEGRRLANLLSLVTGLAFLGFMVLLRVALFSRSATLLRIAGTLTPVVGYVSFLFLCFLGYAFLYGRLPVRRNVDFVVILGAGLLEGFRVSRLLANRLDRGHAIYEAQAARGNPPILLTSGGQGSDEDLPEADAMADYLAERGVPARRIQRENRSRNTQENLQYSKAIMEALTADYRCVVVTNNFHVFRAALTARRTGVRGQVVGSPTAAYFWPSATIREFIAVFVSHKVTNLSISLTLGLLGLAAAW